MQYDSEWCVVDRCRTVVLSEGEKCSQFMAARLFGNVSERDRIWEHIGLELSILAC